MVLHDDASRRGGAASGSNGLLSTEKKMHAKNRHMRCVSFIDKRSVSMHIRDGIWEGGNVVTQQVAPMHIILSRKTQERRIKAVE